ncbi:dTMP kinase [Blastomonas aquatica]|uniref:Thymidylate kinase n=1 Tax=Blastomonas aquatica TaxID=1510276 RepID=A0ABQ1JJQ0_9SPHN|nr:dTMP kinase [Blastomonas aquatica]GGB68846.1 thymidylate kinase [Blastomonas aquatica]
MRGRFISIEGGEAVGKSTQIRLLAEALRADGRKVTITREPGGTESAEAIRTLLLEGGADRWNARSEALLFAAARADHVARLIRPAIEAGGWVLSDRFIDSSRAYQGVAGGLGDEAVLALHQFGSQGFLPDCTLLLELPADEAARRATLRDGAGSDRIGGRDAAYHASVAQAFRTFAAAEPERFHVIDASGESHAVQARIIAALAHLAA